MLVFDPPTNTLELGEQIKKDMSRDILRKRQHLHTRLHICFSTEIFEECLTQIQESLFEHGLTLEDFGLPSVKLSQQSAIKFSKE